jgi:predicted Zn-dependent protease
MNLSFWFNLLQVIMIFGALLMVISAVGMNLLRSKMNTQLAELSIERYRLTEENAALKQEREKYQTENVQLKDSITAEQSKNFFVSAQEGNWRILNKSQAIKKHFNEALKSYEGGKIEQSKDLLQSILKEVPDDVAALNLLGIIHSETGDKTEALRLLNKAYKLSNHPGIKSNINMIEQDQNKLSPQENRR